MKRVESMRLAVVAVVVLVLGAAPVQAQRTLFTDNFNKPGALAGSWYCPVGHWFVQNRILVQDNGGDSNVAFLPDFVLGSQSVEVWLYTNDPAGYGGFFLWRKDAANAVNVRIYPHGGGVWVHEVVDGVGTPVIYGGAFDDATWYKLRVDAESEAGILTIYINDVYFTTYTVTSLMANRIGISGLHSGNTAGGFDNFKLSRLVGGKKK